MRDSGLEEAQAGIKIAERNISNVRYADDTTLMAESEEELKSLFNSVTQSHLTLCYPMDCSPPGSSVHGIFQARVLVITFLPRGKCLLISWLQSASAVILEPKK